MSGVAVFELSEWLGTNGTVHFESTVKNKKNFYKNIRCDYLLNNHSDMKMAFVICFFFSYGVHFVNNRGRSKQNLFTVNNISNSYWLIGKSRDFTYSSVVGTALCVNVLC